MPSKLILVRHSGRRHVDEAGLLESIDEAVRLAPRETVHIDTQQFAEDVAAGQWSGHDAYLRSRAAEVRRIADTSDDPEIHYAGLAELPHVIAFGAALGDERAVVVHEYDRDTDRWGWPNDEPVQEVAVEPVLTGPPVTTAGDAVLRIAISGLIQDGDVRAIVGEEVLADVTVRFADRDARVARVRSEAQLVAIRRAVREALANLKNLRPNIETLHLFVAAPNSVCFVLGQELVPRNSPPAQTYLYRASVGQADYQPAILVTVAAPGARTSVQSVEETELAARLRREVWTKAIAQLKGYADKKQTERERAGAADGPWYLHLDPEEELKRAAPFPALPPIYRLVDQRDEIDPEPFYEDYGYDPEQHLWRIGDALILGLYRAADQDEIGLLVLLRLFFFHEYVHSHHTLTKYTAANVGKFPSALERLDYTADTYAILHELDYQHYAGVERGSGRPGAIQKLGDQVDQIIRSFWAFDGPAPHAAMQVRRVRRYLNWYWRLAQLRRADTVQDAVSLFTRSPAVELAGLRLFTDGERRVFFHFDRTRTLRPELAIVLEDDVLLRLTEGDASSLEGLIDAFRRGDHATLVAWFRPVFEIACRNGEVYPRVHPLVTLPAPERR